MAGECGAGGGRYWRGRHTLRGGWVGAGARERLRTRDAAFPFWRHCDTHLRIRGGGLNRCARRGLIRRDSIDGEAETAPRQAA
jgi:hypothetical protein